MLLQIFTSLFLCNVAHSTGLRPDQCGELLAHLGRQRQLIAGVSVPFDSTGVVHRGQRYSQIGIRYDDRLRTAFYISSAKNPEHVHFTVPLLHGIGGQASHSGAMFSLLSVLEGRVRNNKRGDLSIKREVRDLPTHLETVPIAFDLPGHAAGPLAADFKRLDTFLVWLKQALEATRLPGVPLVPIGRSGSAALLIELNRTYPGFLDGMILISPTHPEIELKQNVEYVLKRAAAGGTPVNHEGLEWIQLMFSQMQWQDSAGLLGNAPTLILFGSEDPQSPPDVREFFSGVHGARSETIDGAGHDVFNPALSKTTLEAYSALYGFLWDIE